VLSTYSALNSSVALCRDKCFNILIQLLSSTKSLADQLGNIEGNVHSHILLKAILCLLIVHDVEILHLAPWLQNNLTNHSYAEPSETHLIGSLVSYWGMVEVHHLSWRDADPRQSTALSSRLPACGPAMSTAEGSRLLRISVRPGVWPVCAPSSYRALIKYRCRWSFTSSHAHFSSKHLFFRSYFSISKKKYAEINLWDSWGWWSVENSATYYLCF
jgi:hypothetical protein